MRIIAIGATGTIGRAVTAALTARNHDVIPVTRPKADETHHDRIAEGLDIIMSEADNLNSA